MNNSENQNENQPQESSLIKTLNGIALFLDVAIGIAFFMLMKETITFFIIGIIIIFKGLIFGGAIIAIDKHVERAKKQEQKIDSLEKRIKDLEINR